MVWRGVVRRGVVWFEGGGACERWGPGHRFAKRSLPVNLRATCTVVMTRDEALLTHDTMSHVTRLVREHGVDCWWTMDVEQLLPPALKASAHK